MGVINKIIGTHSERELKRHKHTLDKVLALKPEMEKLTDDEQLRKISLMIYLGILEYLEEKGSWKI